MGSFLDIEDDEEFPCPKCAEVFSTEAELKTHKKIHRKPRAVKRETTPRPQPSTIKKEDIEEIFNAKFGDFTGKIAEMIENSQPASVKHQINVSGVYIGLNVLILKHLIENGIMTDSDLFTELKTVRRPSVTSSRSNLEKRGFVETDGKVNSIKTWKVTKTGKAFYDAEMERIGQYV